MDEYSARLVERLDAGTAVVAVLGLGYVGLTVAVALASSDLRVIGIDRAEERVAIIARGEKVLDGTVAGVKSAGGRRNIALSLAGGAHNGVGEVLRVSIDSSSAICAAICCSWILRPARAAVSRLFESCDVGIIS